VRHILILLSLLILSFPLVAQETGVLYLKKVNGKFGWFENGNDKKHWKYIGEIKNGKPDGTGVLIHTLGKYSGELKNGLRHGQGTYTYSSGEKYVGEWKNGHRWKGHGTYFYGGEKYVGEWKDGKPWKGHGTYSLTGDYYNCTVIKPTGLGLENKCKEGKFVGEWKDGEFHGQGTLTWFDGRMFVGEFKDTKEHGQGTYTYKSGRKRVGEYRKGKPWNVKNYDKNGKIEAEWVKGIKLIAHETGVLYLKKVNGKFGWFENGNDKKDWKYIGEIKNGKPDGTGVLIHTLGKYSGELKNGLLHGQGTYTYKSGRKRVGEFRKSKEWNVKSYDKNGKIETEWVKGIILEKEEVPLEEKEYTEYKSYEFRVRALLGILSGEKSSSSASVSVIWKEYGLGFNQMSFKSTASPNSVYEMENTTLDLSYTFGDEWTATAGLGYVFGGKGEITINSSNQKYETESVSGYALFGLFGIEWESIEGLIGTRYYSLKYSDLTSPLYTAAVPLNLTVTELVLGFGYRF